MSLFTPIALLQNGEGPFSEHFPQQDEEEGGYYSISHSCLCLTAFDLPVPFLCCCASSRFISLKMAGFSIQPIQIRLSGPCIICCNRILTKKIVKQLEIIDKNFVEIYNEKEFMIFGINMQLWKGELMNIQEIQHQLHLFHQKASVVKEQLTDLLATV